MKRPIVSFLVMIGVIAALFGAFVLMGSFMEDSTAEMAAMLEGEADRVFDLYYEKYMQVKDVYIPELEEGKLGPEDAKLLTQYVFEYYYRCYDLSGSVATVSEEDKKALDEIRDGYMLDVLHSRMQFTDEDMEAAKKDLMENGYFHSSEANKYSDRYYEKYR